MTAGPMAGCGRGTDAMSEPSCPQWGEGKEAFKPGLKFGLERPNSSWVSSLVLLQQLPDTSASFARSAEPWRMQSTSAGHLPSPAPQPGNTSLLTSSFPGRCKDKAPSRARAGAGTHQSPKRQCGDRGHGRCIYGSAARCGDRLLLFSQALPTLRSCQQKAWGN